MLKIGIMIHKISTFLAEKKPSGMFLFSSQDLGIRVNGYSPLGGKGNPNQAWPPKNWLVQILPELPEVWVLMFAECYVAICCYMLLYNVAPPSCKLVYEIINTIVIGVINQLSYLGGPTLYVAMFCFLAADTKYVSSMFHCFWINLKLIHTRTENSNVCFSCFLCNSLWCNSA